MNLSNDPEVYAKQWFYIILAGVVLYVAAVVIFIL
jgi:hypothetical protein